MNMPSGCKEKFADFIRLCSEAKAKGATQVSVACPWVLGDTYEEMIESLARLADAGLLLHIAAREDVASRN
jgi:dihydrodipicolinate synthase/N-acetylneuraminate lyase